MNILRHVELTGTGFTLLTWETHHRCETGQHRIGYAFTAPDGLLLFSGDDCGVAPSHAIDSNAALRGLLGFLTLRPGDTDSEYFDKYTPAQLAFAEKHGEELSMWGMEAESFDDSETEPPGFTNLDDWMGRGDL